jgi:threonine dehydrogenase-like Zn-dependent dehydrogenase
MRGVRSTVDGIRVVETAPPDSDGVRVTVTSSGICGSDIHLASFGPLPVTLGHEFCGRLDDGTPVAVLPAVPCGQCPQCVAGDEQQCPDALSTLYGIGRDGGLADEVWVDPWCVRPVPAGATFEHANLVEPLAVALHGINRAGATAGTKALVIGAGPVGLCTIAALSSLGIDVDLLAHRRRRIEAGEQLGAGTAVSDRYDVVFDAAGTQGSLDSAIQLARPGGTVGLLGTFWEPVSLGAGFQVKEVTVVPAFAYGHHHGVSEFDDAIRVLDAAPELPDAVITHHFGLDDATEAFRVASDREADAIKVVIHP